LNKDFIMSYLKKLCLALIVSACLSGCGYQLGLVGKDTSINYVYCYTVKNETRMPGMEMHATNSIINTLSRRGGHVKVVSDKNKADTFLYVKLIDYDRASARFDEADVTQQSMVNLYATMYLYRSPIDDQLKEKNENTPQLTPFLEIDISATATYFLEPNQPEGERSIRPQLYYELSNKIVDQIVNRWSNEAENDL